MVEATLSASVKNTGFALYVESIQDSLPDDKKMTVFDVMALCEIRDGAKRPSDKDIALKLEKLGAIEKHGKTNAQYYILPRKYYELSGNTAEYSLKTDWDINQVWAILCPFLHKYGTAKRGDINKIVGSHLSDKQLRNILSELKELNLIYTDNNQTRPTYYLSIEFESEEQALIYGFTIINKSKSTERAE